MTRLERGLALTARKEGMPVYKIALALHRDERTLAKLFARHGLPKRKPGPKPRRKPHEHKRIRTEEIAEHNRHA